MTVASGNRASACAASASASQKAALPRRASMPSTIADTPWPACSLASGEGRYAARLDASAAASGCRLDRARRAASARGSGSIRAALTTRGSGVVSVPVLSKTMVSHCAMRSIASPDCSSTPARNRLPEATTCVAGTASASAQGQVMIRTAMAVMMAWCNPAPASDPADGRRAAPSRARRANRSAPRDRRGADSASERSAAVSTRRLTSCSSVPSAAAVTRTVSAPLTLTVPA